MQFYQICALIRWWKTDNKQSFLCIGLFRTVHGCAFPNELAAALSSWQYNIKSLVLSTQAEKASFFHTVVPWDSSPGLTGLNLPVHFPRLRRLSSRVQELIALVATFLSGKWTVHSNLVYKAHKWTCYQPEFCLWIGPKSELMTVQRLRNNHNELHSMWNRHVVHAVCCQSTHHIGFRYGHIVQFAGTALALTPASAGFCVITNSGRIIAYCQAHKWVSLQQHYSKGWKKYRSYR